MEHSLMVRVVQANPIVGDLAGNLAQVKAALDSAADVDLLVFPECFLTGYPLQDLVLRPGFIAMVDAALDDLSAFVHQKGGPAVLIGAPLAGADLPFNAAYLLRPDGTRQVAVKAELPNSDVFDERRIFARGAGGTPLLLGSWRLGVMICEDMWHGAVARQLADEGADFLLVINGSPMEIGKQPIRHGHARRRVLATRLPLLYANLTGGQDEMVFDGSSFVLDASGALVAQAGMDRDTLDVAVVRNESGVEVKSSSLIRAYPDEMEAIYRTLVMGLRDYVGKNGFGEVLLGLSGGLDSAIVAAIASDALGPDRVIALMLPAAYTGTESKDLAHDMAHRLGCHYDSIPVGAVVAELETSLTRSLDCLGGEIDRSARGVASENLQARVRGTLLMAVSNSRPGALVLSTGNKSEMSVGYATLYGDMCGGFNPIKDLYKTKVQALARWRNDHIVEGFLGPTAPIPEGILTRPPTAELAEGQADENTLGAYPVLDAVLNAIIEQQLGPAAAAHAASVSLGSAVEVDYAVRIAGLVKRAEYKRRQAPPGIKLTARSFGFGWRYPITNRGPLA